MITQTNRCALAITTVIILGATALGTARLSAQTDRSELNACLNNRTTLSADAQISICTKVIQSGQLSEDDLSLAYSRRAVIYARRDDFDHAIADFTEVLRLKPTFGTLTQRGQAYFGKKDYDNAIADYSRAIELFTDDPTGYEQRGEAYFAKKDFDHAMADFNEAIRLEPTYADPYYYRGLTKRIRGDKAGGDADVARARQLGPQKAVYLHWSE